MREKFSSGFTLVEIAIVMVIIGLIVGGILVGRNLIESGRQQRVSSEIHQLSTSATAFRLKYGCLPGDCGTQAIAAGGIPTPNCAVGAYIPDNGFIEMSGVPAFGYSPATCANLASCSCEQGRFAYQLNGVGMLQNEMYSLTSQVWLHVVVSTAYKNSFLMPYSWYYSGGPSDHWIMLLRADRSGYFTGVGTNAGNDWKALSPVAANALDTKLDDGKPLTGTVRMVSDLSGSGGSLNALGVWTSAHPEYSSCATSNSVATSKYRTDEDTAYGCRLAFRSGF